MSLEKSIRRALSQDASTDGFTDNLPWLTRRTGYIAYANRYFSEAIDRMPAVEREYEPIEKLTRYISRLRDPDGSLIGIDLMGYGHVLQGSSAKGANPRFTSGLAVSLSDTRTERDKQRHEKKGIQLYERNILRASVWKEISDWLHTVRPEKPFADAIFCMPLGGIENVPHNVRLERVLLGKALNLLHDKGAVMLGQLPQEYAGGEENRILNEW